MTPLKIKKIKVLANEYDSLILADQVTITGEHERKTMVDYVLFDSSTIVGQQQVQVEHLKGAKDTVVINNPATVDYADIKKMVLKRLGVEVIQ